jgi:hypothetical protein
VRHLAQTWPQKYKIHLAIAIPLTGFEGLQGCEMLRMPHCLDNRLTDGGEVVGTTNRPRSTPQKHKLSVSVTHFF